MFWDRRLPMQRSEANGGLHQQGRQPVSMCAITYLAQGCVSRGRAAGGGDLPTSTGCASEGGTFGDDTGKGGERRWAGQEEEDLLQVLVHVAMADGRSSAARGGEEDGEYWGAAPARP